MVKLESRVDHKTGEVDTTLAFVGEAFPGRFVSFIDVMRQLIQAYEKGIDIERWFTPDRNVERDTEMIKCQWRSDGTLRVIEEHAPKRFLHASSVDEAMSRSRNFTCSRYLYKVCPKRRGKDKCDE